MREIKCRGIRVDIKEWVYGNLIECAVTGKKYIFPVGSCANESDKVGQEGCLMIFTFEVIPETVGQFTGLHDKNGVEIYTGDKVIIEKEDDEEIFIVKCDNNSARFIMESETYILDFDNYGGTDCEVIGNVHERSEDNDK